MTSTVRRTATSVLAAAAMALALVACAGSSEPTTTPVPEATLGDPGDCAQVTVIVDFGPLDEPSIGACVAAGQALDVLDAAGVTTEGTADYGDAVVCRVNGNPSPDEPVELDGVEPFTETCTTLNSAAYWALWVRTAADGEWEYAQEGVNTLELADGQSVGLVYTPGTDSIPPQG